MVPCHRLQLCQLLCIRPVWQHCLRPTIVRLTVNDETKQAAMTERERARSASGDLGAVQQPRTPGSPSPTGYVAPACAPVIPAFFVLKVKTRFGALGSSREFLVNSEMSFRDCRGISMLFSLSGSVSEGQFSNGYATLGGATTLQPRTPNGDAHSAFGGGAIGVAADTPPSVRSHAQGARHRPFALGC